jgi:predicted RNase H-like HicB family nuclease
VVEQWQTIRERTANQREKALVALVVTHQGICPKRCQTIYYYVGVLLSLTQGEIVSMNRQLTAVIEREGNGYVSFCPEVDVASQGDTVQEASENLKEAVELFFETAPKEEISRRLHNEVYVTRLEVMVG